MESFQISKITRIATRIASRHKNLRRPLREMTEVEPFSERMFAFPRKYPRDGARARFLAPSA